MVDVGPYLLVCLLSSIPGPPGITFQDAYLQLFPVDKTKCPTINPIRDIAYELYTSENPLQADMINVGDDAALASSHFDFYKPTVFFFHAFFESSSSDSATLIKTAYLQRKDYNVILLQAQRMEAGPWYLTAARNTRVVGEYTATFIDYLVSRGMDLNSVHLIGLSLGAQMAGVCGQNVRSGRIQRITGLDPAGPLFTKWPKNLKLDASDAEFVDIIHTDAGIFGYPRSTGHVDFWPNRGQSPQPGCRLEEVKRRSPDAFLIEPLFCSHWRSYQFYAESVITPDSFIAVNCKNWGRFLRGDCKDNQQVNMGINVSPDARGSYFLQTRDISPFSLQSEVPQRQLQQYPIPTHSQQQEQPQLLEQPKILVDQHVPSAQQEVPNPNQLHESQIQGYVLQHEDQHQGIIQEAPLAYEQHHQHQYQQQPFSQPETHQELIGNHVNVQQSVVNPSQVIQNQNGQHVQQHPMLNYYYYQK